MKKNAFGTPLVLRVFSILIIPFLFIQASSLDLMFTSHPASDWHEDLEPCDLLPSGGEVSSQSEDVCVGQYASEWGKKVVQVQTNTYNVETDRLCDGLYVPDDFRVFMNDVYIGDCGIQAEISYQGEPAPGYTGWQILYYYQGISVRVATSDDYPANQSWVYDTAEAIETIIRNLSGEEPETAKPEEPVEMPPSHQTEGIPKESQGIVRKSQEECDQLQQEVADMADRALASNVADLKLGVIAEVVSAPADGPAVQEYCGGGEGAVTYGSQIKIGDCIRNGEGLLVLMKDQDRNDSRGTLIELGKDDEDGEICFDEFIIYDEPGIESVTQLVNTTIHVIHKTWKGTSIFSTRQTYTVIIGVRGSEAVIQSYSDSEYVRVVVLEGHVDVTTEKTGETVALTDNEGVMLIKGDVVYIGDVSQEIWDSYLEEYGFSDMDFILKPVGFVNYGSINATVMPWTYIPLGESVFQTPVSASTVSFAMGTGGSWPNSSRFISVPMGTYTWCIEWEDEDKDGDGYFDYYHYYDTTQTVLDENDSDEMELAEQVDIMVPPGIAPYFKGKCGEADILP